MPYADQWLSNSIPSRLEPAAQKEDYSSFLVAIDDSRVSSRSRRLLRGQWYCTLEIQEPARKIIASSSSPLTISRVSSHSRRPLRGQWCCTLEILARWRVQEGNGRETVLGGDSKRATKTTRTKTKTSAIVQAMISGSHVEVCHLPGKYIFMDNL